MKVADLLRTADDDRPPDSTAAQAEVNVFAGSLLDFSTSQTIAPDGASSASQQDAQTTKKSTSRTRKSSAKAPRKSKGPTFILENPRIPGSRKKLVDDVPPASDSPPVKKRKVGRPRKDDADLKRPRHDRYRQLDRPTKIHGNSIVQTELPVEIWDNICLFMDPRTMMRLRTTCKKLYEQISSEVFLRRYRELHFGPGCPPCPEGLTEIKYIDLLGGGTGCMGCGARKTHKVQWAFLTRLCEKCLDAAVFKIGSQMPDRSSFVGKYARLISCIAKGEIDTHSNYACILKNPEPFNLRTVSFNGTMFLKKDFGKIADEFEKFKLSLQPPMTPQALDQTVQDWVLPKKEACDALMNPLKEIEEHVQGLDTRRKHTDNSQRKIAKDDRRVYFEAKCAQLDPPIPAEHCRLMPPFLEAIKYDRPPSETSWTLLKPKLIALRDAAAELWALKGPEFPAPRSAEYERASKNHNEHPVHELLENLAKDAVMSLTGRSPSDQPIAGIDLEAQCNGTSTSTNRGTSPARVQPMDLGAVAVCDLPYLALKKTRQMYYSLDATQRPNASKKDLLPAQLDGTYTLCMEDARKIYDTVIAQTLPQWPLFRQREGKILRCPGCTRKDYFRGRTFKQLFEHLMKHHGKILGDDFSIYHRIALEFGQYPDTPAGGFPWLAVEWPPHLPIQTPYQVATGSWDPNNEDFEYITQGRVLKEGEVQVSAFAQRSPPTLEKQGDLVKDMTNALIESWDSLKTTTLSTASKASICWRYAIWRVDNTTKELSTEGNRHIIYAVAVYLVRVGRHDVMNNLKCKACAGTTDKYHQKYVDHARSFLELAHHFRDRHVNSGFLRRDRGGYHWTDVSWLDMTSGEDLLHELERDAVARESFDTLFPIVPMGPNLAGAANLSHRPLASSSVELDALAAPRALDQES